MPGKKKKEKPSTKLRAHSSPFPLHPESLGILSQMLSLGEKNEIQFKRVFMENRPCAQRPDSRSFALGGLWAGAGVEAARPLPCIHPGVAESPKTTAVHPRSEVCSPGVGGTPPSGGSTGDSGGPPQASSRFWCHLTPIPPPPHTSLLCVFSVSYKDGRPSLNRHLGRSLLESLTLTFCRDYLRIRSYPRVPGEPVFCG